MYVSLILETRCVDSFYLYPIQPKSSAINSAIPWRYYSRQPEYFHILRCIPETEQEYLFGLAN